MKIIAIEGLDKGGKHTLATALHNRLAAQGLTVVRSEFHDYSTPTGKLIMDWLTGKYDADQHTIELIMTADKQYKQKWFEELERQGVDVLILDRYMTSQMVYSAANGIKADWTDELQRFLRIPDYEILIDIPAEVSMERKGKHNDGNNDRYESDRDMLRHVREYYLSYFEMKMEYDSTHFIVDGTESIEEVEKKSIDFVLGQLALTN